MRTSGDLHHPDPGDPGDGIAPGARSRAGRTTGTKRTASIGVALLGIVGLGLLTRIVAFPGGVFLRYGSAVEMHSTVDEVALIGMLFPDLSAVSTREISATARIAPGSAASIIEIVVCHNDGSRTVAIGASSQLSDLRLYCQAVEPADHAQLGPHDSLLAVVVPLASGTITIEGVDVTRHRSGRDITEHSGVKATIEVAG